MSEILNAASAIDKARVTFTEAEVNRIASDAAEYATAVLSQQLAEEQAKVKAKDEALTTAIKQAMDACFCHGKKGFDYGEKHPKLGVCPSGRWLSPKEILRMALAALQSPEVKP